MTDLRQAPDAARAIAAAALGRDPGPMATVESSSHHVYVSPDGRRLRFISMMRRSAST